MDFSSFVNETFHRLARQGEQSIKPGPSGMTNNCMYFGPNGTHCAIGFWIDESLELKLKTETTVILGDYLPLNETGIEKILPYLPTWLGDFGVWQLGRIQVMHDRTEHWLSPQHLIAAMKQFCVDAGIAFDTAIEPEVWANWKGNPPLTDPVLPALPVAEKDLAPVAA